MPGTENKPRVILGCMTFGPDVDKGARVTTLEEYNQCLDYLQGAGYNEIDTARVYIGGKQEAWTADAKWKERGLTLATKVYPFQPGLHSPEKLRETFETSLKELRTDKVDIFYLHAADRSVPFADTLRTCNDLYNEGKFSRLGLSNFTAFEVAEIVTMCHERGWVRPTIYQGMYNAILRTIETELIPACHRYGLDIVVYNPIAGGLFSGKIKSKDIVPESGRFSNTGVAGAMYRKRYFRDSTFNALKIVEEATEKAGLTMIETALRWAVHHSDLNIKDGGRDGIIIGVSSIDQLKGNITDLEKGPLPEELVEALDAAWMECKAEVGPYWHLDLKYQYDTQKVLFGDKA